MAEDYKEHCRRCLHYNRLTSGKFYCSSRYEQLEDNDRFIKTEECKRSNRDRAVMLHTIGYCWKDCITMATEENDDKGEN